MRVVPEASADQRDRSRSEGDDENHQDGESGCFPLGIESFLLENRRMPQADQGGDQGPEKPSLPEQDAKGHESDYGRDSRVIRFLSE